MNTCRGRPGSETVAHPKSIKRMTNPYTKKKVEVEEVSDDLQVSEREELERLRSIVHNNNMVPNNNIVRNNSFPPTGHNNTSMMAGTYNYGGWVWQGPPQGPPMQGPPQGGPPFPFPPMGFYPGNWHGWNSGWGHGQGNGPNGFGNGNT